jgi:very-short-patch-repair endonuclease
MNRHWPQYEKSSIPNARRLRRQMTDAERRIWSKLRNNQLGLKIRRQAPFAKFIPDFYCPKAKLCIELDGSQHCTEEGLRKDDKRDKELNALGVEVLRFSDYDASRNPDRVLQTIYEKIFEKSQQEIPTYPSPEMGRDTLLLQRRRRLQPEAHESSAQTDSISSSMD